ncbi:type II toxin-antitoxin system HipA family toxin YjjJ [Ramlibacter sp.]|uniref:type II toxin-antitoxin system HipA family toxin YjjJ n=1 Tax=Ramlibacter sp. TaxID=1917967 RepID=UPI003D0FCCF5
MSVPDDLLRLVRTWGRLPAGEVARRLGISRPTLTRAVHALDSKIVVRGRARRTAYAARRAVRGGLRDYPLYSIDANAKVEEVAALTPLQPQGTAVAFRAALAWPLDPAMQDGWFDGLPYPMEDMRPQGFLGRSFARVHAALLQVSTDPRQWSEDDVLHSLSVLGSDQPGAYIVGEAALREWFNRRQDDPPSIADDELDRAYPGLAAEAMQDRFAGSSAGGEFPKFTAVRRTRGEYAHVIVKFSGSDEAPGTLRWSDLLVCEHLAARTLRDRLKVDAADSAIHKFGGRTFLEVKRFDRHGAHGRSQVCSWFALNAALFGMAGAGWSAGAQALEAAGHVDRDTKDRIELLWHFGRLIGNTDMHDGNLSFRPGLQLAPAYDMLPMTYAPERGVEVPERAFQPALPLPAERSAWARAVPAAEFFWRAAADDDRISTAFRRICEANAERLKRMASEG